MRFDLFCGVLAVCLRKRQEIKTYADFNHTQPHLQHESYRPSAVLTYFSLVSSNSIAICNDTFVQIYVMHVGNANVAFKLYTLFSGAIYKYNISAAEEP